MLEPDCWYTISDIQTVLETKGFDINYRTLWYWVRHGNIETIRPGRNIQVSGKSFNAFFYDKYDNKDISLNSEFSS